MSRSAGAIGGTLGAVAAAGAATLAWGVAVERNRFTVRHETLPVLEPDARPITILHLSDLHMAPWQRAKQDFVRSLAVYEPDLVIDTGDNLGHADGIDGIRRALEPFAGAAGLFVHGSNDYFGPEFKNPFGYFAPRDKARRTKRSPDLDTAALNAYLVDELGWFDLNNAVRAVEVKGTRLELFGTGDAHKGWDRLGELPGAVEELRENVEWSTDERRQVLTIAATHAPYRRVLDAFVSQGADLIFAGHTHGGQVRIPGRPALVTNCDIPPAQAQGLSVWRTGAQSAFLEVSAGLGTSIYAPVRFACPPEAIVMTLTPVSL
ncbi:metallophosphoesterase [Homoserinibacter sp. GY 40078]|uniref:metallophosphoesterase n=1 Tax=Homoserinibacter sp. GY 40078 TaxID=2603275 RepID=UPI0011C7485D|nr:metallophosphoesterase [Homoserinibacter sp. GY 40078]TXK18463.1 metallophosphoesterase [Homoserinibacter sp. GY 40078]